MAKKQRFVTLGIFVLVGTILTIVGLFAVGNQQDLFSSSITIRAYFSDVEGLRQGAPVRLSGINIGMATDIKLSPHSADSVIVVMKIKKEHAERLRTSARAFIETEGLVGNKVVNLRLNGDDAKIVEDGDRIVGVDPVGLGVIVDDMRDVLANTDSLTRSLAEIVHKANEGEGSVAKFINDPSLYDNANRLILTTDEQLRAVTAKLDSFALTMSVVGAGTSLLLSDVSRLIRNVDSVVAGVKEGRGALGLALADTGKAYQDIVVAIGNARAATEELKLAAGRAAENMEALKHNWLFKDYFEERGYYDETGYEMKLEDYLEEVDEKLLELERRIERYDSTVVKPEPPELQ